MKQSEIIISTGHSDEVGAPDLDEVAESGLDSETRHWTVGPELHGLRLDQALAVLVPEFSRSYLQQHIDAGAVTLSGVPMRKPSTRVRAGNVGTIELRPTQQSQAFKPQAMGLDVVYEDAHLLVINKPAGMVVHPAPGNWSGTLLNGLLGRDAGASRLPRAGIVHRLDKDTSGLMVVARTRETMDALVRLIAARDVRRQYLALAHRPWAGNATRHVDAPIGRDPRNRLRMAVVDLAKHAGKTAGTTFELLDNVNAGCWVRCTLQTGRTHQIRVHMASIGHPLVADALYGGAPAAGMARQALHAWRLALAHPVTGESLDLRSNPPPDMLQALREWGVRYNES